MDKIFAVQNCGISGTVFLQSLFDGHPKILSMPALTAQTLLMFWERNWNFDRSVIIENFLVDFDFLFQVTPYAQSFGLSDLGINQNENACVDQSSFLSHLTQQSEWISEPILSRKNFIISIFKAYNLTIGRAIDDDGYILYPIHCLPKKYADELVEDFSEVKFLHMMREPIQNVGSMASHISKNSQWSHNYLLSCSVSQMFLDYTIHVGYRRAHGLVPYVSDNEKSTTRALKLEDVHKDAKNSLLKICKWLKISWDDCLLQSTFNGKLWHNRPETIRQTGIGSKTIAQKHENLMSQFDRARLSILSKKYNHYYGYQNQSNHNSFLIKLLMPILIWVPFRMEFFQGHIHERLRDYVVCRFKYLLPAWLKTFTKKRYIELLE